MCRMLWQVVVVRHTASTGYSKLLETTEHIQGQIMISLHVARSVDTNISRPANLANQNYDFCNAVTCPGKTQRLYISSMQCKKVRFWFKMLLYGFDQIHLPSDQLSRSYSAGWHCNQAQVCGWMPFHALQGKSLTKIHPSQLTLTALHQISTLNRHRTLQLRLPFHRPGQIWQPQVCLNNTMKFSFGSRCVWLWNWISYTDSSTLCLGVIGES